MLPRRKIQRRRCTPHKASIYFDITVRNVRLHCQSQGCCCWSARNRSANRGKLRDIELHVSLYECGHLGSLWNRDVLAVDEQKQWSSREEYNRGPHHCACHRTDVSATFSACGGAQHGLAAIDQTNAVDIHIELATAA